MKKASQRLFFAVFLSLFLVACSQLNSGNHESAEMYARDTAKVHELLKLFSQKKDSNLVSQMLPLAEEALTLSEKINYDDGIADAAEKLSMYYNAIGDYLSAMKSLLKSLAINEKSDDILKLAKNYSDIGISYYLQKNYNEALQHYQKAIALNQKAENKKGIATDKYLIALVYSEEGADSMALDYFYQSLEIQNQLRQVKRVGECEQVIGDIYLKQKQYSEALKMYNRAARHFEEANETMGIPNIKISLAKLFLETNQLGKAEEYALDGIKYFTGIKYSSRMITTYEILHQVYAAQGKFEKAYDVHATLVTMRDSVLNTENANKISALQSSYALDKKQTEIEHQQRQIKTQQTLRNAFMGGFVIVAVLAFFAFMQYRIKKKTSVKLEIALRNLEKTQEHLIHKEKMSSLGELSAGIAHEIRNPLNFVTNFSDLTVHLINEYRSSSSAEEQDELLRDIGTNLDKINQHGKRADRIVENMLSQVHKGAGEKKPINLNSLSEEFFTLALQSARLKDPNFDCEVEKKYDGNLPLVNANEQDISRVLINLFNNALYELRKKKIVEGNNYVPKISIASYASANKVFFSVSDNGPGISDELRAKIFQPFFTTKGMGEGTGLGLSLSREVIEQGHQGKLEVISSEGKGSKFIISLPA